MSSEINIDQLHSFFELSSELMAILTEDGCFLETNLAWQKSLGFQAHELKTRPYTELLHVDDLSKAQLEIQKLHHGAKMVAFDGRCRRKNQEYLWVRWTCHFIGGDKLFYLAGRDISELKESEKALEESRAQFKRLSESATEGVAIHDKGIIVEANQALARIFGFEKAEDMVGKNGLDFTAPEYRQLILNNIQAGFEEPYEVVGLRKDGSRFDCLISGKSVRYQGRLVRVSTFLDITKMKRREQELFESQELFRKLAEASKDGIVVSEKGMILMANPALAEMFGVEVSEMIGRNALEFAAPEFRELVIKKVLDDNEKKYEVMGLRKDGTRFPIEVTPRMTTYQGRRVRLAFFRDITQRKKIEEEVLRQKEFSQNLINSSIDGLMAFDLECRYTLWNPAMERLTGHSREEVLGQCAFDVFPFLKQIGQDRFFQEALQGKIAVTKDRPYRTPAGREGFFEAVYSPIKTPQGEIVGGLGIIHETTERKKVEEALQQSETNLKAVFTNTFQNIVLMDREGRIQAFNPNAAADFRENSGKDLEVGRFLSEYVHADNADLLARNLSRALKGEAVQLERSYRMGDGESHWFEINYHPVFGAAGEIEGICLTSLNIDDRKRVHQALQKSEADLRAVFNSSIWGFILAGPNGKIRDFNQIARQDVQKMRGQALEVGRSLSEYVEPEHVKDFKERFRRVLKGEILHLERTVKTPSGEDHWFEFIYNPVCDSQGRVMGVCVALGSIDERKKAAEALRKSEGELRALFNSVNQSIVLLDAHGVIQNFNKTAQAVFLAAIGSELKMGEPFLNYVRSEDREEARGRLGRALKGELVRFERSYRFADGVPHWVEYVYHPVFDENGNLTGVCFTSEFIDERKKAAEALQKSESNLKAIFNSSIQGIMVMDRDGLIQYFNQAAFSFVVDSMGKVLEIGKPFLDYLPTEARELFQGKVASVLKGGVVRGENNYRFLDGSFHWFEYSYNPVLDAYGAVTGICLTSLPIGDRKKAEEALKESEEKFRRVFENASIGMTLVDPNFRFIHVNRTFCDILGYPEEELVGKTFRDITHPDDLPRNVAYAQEIKNGKGFQMQKRYLRKNGSIVWAKLRVDAFLNAKGEFLYSLGMVEDITHRKWAEDASRQSEEKFRKIFEDASMAMAMVSDYKFVKVNRAFQDLLGYSEEEITGKTVFEITHPADLPKTQDIADKMHHQEKESFKTEKRYLRKDGQSLWVNVSGTLIRDAAGNKLYSLIMVENITDRKLTQEALHKSEAELRAVFNSGSQVTILIRPDGNIQGFNKSAEIMAARVLGKKLEKGMPFIETLPPGASPEVFLASFKDALEGKETRGERSIVAAGGEGRWVEVKYQPVQNDKGGVDGVCFSLSFIDERKRAEEALQKSGADLRAVFNSGSQMIVLIGRDGRIRDYNQNAGDYVHRMAGKRFELGTAFLDYVQPPFQAAVQERIEKVLKGETLHVESSVQGIDGETHWFEMNFSPVFDGQGAVTGVCMSSTLIDERRKAEEALRENQERFQRLVEVTQEGILIHEQPRVVDANPALAAMMGYTQEEMIGKSGFDFLAPESREIARRHMLEGSHAPYEVLALRKDGSVFPVELQGRNFQFKGRELRVLSVRDLTWRKEAERILTESEDRYRRLVELSPEAIVVHSGGKVLYVNPAGLEMFGAAHTNVEGYSILEFLHPESKDMAMDRVRQIMKTGEATHWVEQKLMRLNGEEFLAETKGIPFLYKGIPSVLTILRDITERKKTQELLLRFERLAAVGKVIAAIAHEVRNPLAVVSGMSQILKAKLENRSEYSQELETILSQAGRLKYFMNDILDYSRSMEIHKTEVKLKTLLEESLVMAQAQVGPRHSNVKVEWKMEQSLPPLSADGGRLEQVLVNLILNAYQAAEAGGKIILSAVAQDGWMCLGVEDDGPGIPEADMPRLFEPFFTTKKNGSGLGLSISQKIVQAHGGKIEVKRIQPHGTLFTLQLPLDPD